MQLTLLIRRVKFDYTIVVANNELNTTTLDDCSFEDPQLPVPGISCLK